ncbi:MAG: sulfatase-like hydrolase/transferase [Candidatus Electrothrix sp. Rat3]|nr:sulfatase-like hydrolase/transferase [Candidatus Electrothrix rattekaaiensis]
MFRKLENGLFHPFLFALYPLIAFYSKNIDHTTFLVPLLTMLGIIPIVFLVIFFLNLITKNNMKSGMMTSVLVILFFTYGHTHSLILDLYEKKYVFKAIFKNLDLGANLEASLHHTLLLGFFFICILAYIFILFLDKGEYRITQVLNAASALLVIMSLLGILFSLATIHRGTLKGNKWEGEKVFASEKRPDIYYIILDGYARSDVLSTYYGFDNTPFTTFLKEKDFYVVDNGYANYTWTFLSLPSSLNYSYINSLKDIVGEKSLDLRIPFEMIKNNHASQFLKSQGYTYVHVNSTWGATLKNRYADFSIGYSKSFFSNEYLRVLSRTTILKCFNSLVDEQLATFYLHAFEELKKIPQMVQPTFTFAHFILPHYPYIFNSKGEVISEITRKRQFANSLWPKKKQYIAQLAFVNKKVEEIIAAILSNSSEKPIIIIQSDHGPKVHTTFDNKQLSEDEFIRARHANFNAIYLPGKGREKLYETLTPVNTFRIIFNEYFNAGLEELEDKIYFSDFKTPYMFREIELSGQQPL